MHLNLLDTVNVMYCLEVNIPESSSAVQSLIEASSASMEHGWEVGWSLASHNRGPQHIMDAIHSQVI